MRARAAPGVLTRPEGRKLQERLPGTPHRHEDAPPPGARPDDGAGGGWKGPSETHPDQG